MDRVQVEILGISTSQSNGSYALILREVAGTRRLPIIIGGFEAQAIAMEMEAVKPARPLTHDLLKIIIETLGATVTDVTIVDHREGTFFAVVRINNEIDIDARPSDAIAIAIRFGVNMYVAEEIFASQGFLPDEEEDDGDESEEDEDSIENQIALGVTNAGDKVPPSSHLEELQQQLADAIRDEDYERAAKIRDDIEQLKRGADGV